MRVRKVLREMGLPSRVANSRSPSVRLCAWMWSCSACNSWGRRARVRGSISPHHGASSLIGHALAQQFLEGVQRSTGHTIVDAAGFVDPPVQRPAEFVGLPERDVELLCHSAGRHQEVWVGQVPQCSAASSPPPVMHGVARHRVHAGEEGAVHDSVVMCAGSEVDPVHVCVDRGTAYRSPGG